MVLTTLVKVLIATVGSIIYHLIAHAIVGYNFSKFTNNSGKPVNLLFMVIGFALLIAGLIFAIKFIGLWTILYAVIGTIIGAVILLGTAISN